MWRALMQASYACSGRYGHDVGGTGTKLSSATPIHSSYRFYLNDSKCSKDTPKTFDMKSYQKVDQLNLLGQAYLNVKHAISCNH